MGLSGTAPTVDPSSSSSKCLKKKNCEFNFFELFCFHFTVRLENEHQNVRMETRLVNIKLTYWVFDYLS